MGRKSLESTNLIGEICTIAKNAGQIINSFILGEGQLEYRLKEDMSPVTAADEAANSYIVAAITNLKPAMPIIAEESIGSEESINSEDGPFWLVDPLDGTKEFIAGRDEFTVNIALITNAIPTLGVIYLPAQDCIYWGQTGKGAFKAHGNQNPIQIHTKQTPARGATVVGSRSHSNTQTEEWLSEQKIVSFQPAGSSLKFCKVAEGSADLYPRFGRTMEWDTAAGHAILLAAGGRVETTTGAPLTYGKPHFENPHFLARGS